MKLSPFYLSCLVLFATLISGPAISQETVTEPKTTADKPAQSETTAPEPKQAAEVPPGYDFTIETQIPCTSVKNQGSTGTCWCFATASFIESEIMRMGKGEHDLSEMFVVRNIYQDKARNYLMRQGKTNFGEGALAHDFIRAASRHGVVPNAVYTGLEDGAKGHNHGEMFKVMEGMLKGLVEQKSLTPKWPAALDSVMDVYMGSTPT